MPTFTYKAVDAGGKTRTGGIEAEDRRSAARKLAGQGFRVVALHAGNRLPDVIAGAQKFSDSGEMPAKLKQKRFFGTHRSGWDFIDSFYQLHESGLAPGDAVKLLSQRVNDPALRFLCQSLWRDIGEGATIAGAMSRFPAVFDNSTIYLIEAGENTGNLLPVLKKLLADFQVREDLRAKIISGISYPIFLCFIAVAILALFVFFLVPKMEQMMANLSGEFPWTVKALVAFADVLVKGGPFIALAIFVGSFALSRWRKTESGREKTDSVLLKIPLLGKVIAHTEIISMTNLLSTLLGSGINTTEALRLSERPVDNRVLRGRLSASRQMINDGAAFASAFKRHAVLDLSDLDILSVGENTGSLADTFQMISKRHVTGLDKTMKRLLNVLVTIVFGSTVSLIFVCMVSIFLTILSVSQNILKH